MINKISVLYLGIILKLTLSLLTDRYIAINIAPEFYGTFKYYVTLITVFSTVTGLGLNVGIVKELSGLEVSANKQKKVLIFSIVFSLLAALIFYGLCANGSILSGIGIRFTKEFQLISITVIVITLNKLFVSILSINSNVKVKVIVNDLLQPLVLFGGVFYLNNISLQNIIWVFIFSHFFICLINIIVFYKSFKLILMSREWLSVSIKDYVLYCAPILLTNILIVLSTEIDKLVLSFLISKNSLGIYYTAAVLSSLLSLILGTLVFIYLPLASKMFNEKNYLRASLVSSYVSKWLMLFSFIPFWALFSFPKDIIILFYSSEYINASKILSILALAQYVNLSAGFTGQNLIALGDSKGQLVIRIIGFVFGLILTITFGNQYGPEGVAIALIVSLFCTNSLQIARIKIKFNIHLYRRANLIGLVFVLIMAILLKIINAFLFNIDSMGLFIINIILFGVCLRSFLINKKDIQAFKIIQKLI